MKFKSYLINEASDNLGEKIGDILSALESLNEDMPNLGTRQIIHICNHVVTQIRKVLKDDYPDTEIEVLKKLQKVGVALMKGIDSNDDLKEIIAAALDEVQAASSSLGEPVNKLATEE